MDWKAPYEGALFGEKIFKVVQGEQTPAYTPIEVNGRTFTGWEPAVTPTATEDASYVAQWDTADPSTGGDEEDEPSAQQPAEKEEPEKEEPEKEEPEKEISVTTEETPLEELTETSDLGDRDLTENETEDEIENEISEGEGSTEKEAQTLTVTVNYVDAQTNEPIADAEEKTLISDTGTFEVTALEIEGYVLADLEKHILPVELNEDGSAKPVTFLYEQAHAMDTMDFIPQGEEPTSGLLGIRGIGRVYLDHTRGVGTFQALVGLNVTTSEANYKPVSGVTIKVYDDIGSRYPADYADKTPIATFTTGSPYIFNSEADHGVDRYRNTGKMEIEGHSNKDRNLFFIASKEGFEPRGSQGYISPGYRVAFVSEGKTYKVTYASPNTLVTAPAEPVREGYTFDGWYKEQTLKNEWNFENDKITGNTYLYAKWTPNFTVTYTDGVEGQEVFADQKYENLPEGSDTPAFSGTPTRSGYTFKGWLPQVAPTVTANATYVAQWEQIIVTKPTVYYESNGGTYVAPYYNVPHGSVINAPKNPVREGYTFTGWYRDTALKTRWNFKEDGVYNTMTLYAGWRSTSDIPNTGDEGITPYVTLALMAMVIGLGSYGLIKKTKKKTNCQ